jgi:peptide/nickel transport system substrate-binding protein
MDRETRRQIEEYRRSAAGPIENNLIDELVANELDRQEFIRRAAMFGLGAGTIGALLRFVGEADLAFGAPAAPAKKGGTLRVGNFKPARAIDPITSNTQAVLAATSITGEYLLFTDPRNNALRPVLATSYKPDKTGKRWTFQLRKDVKFHTGAPMTADDVVATFRRLTDPKNASEALSAFKGVLSPGGVRKAGRYTVVFVLDAPTPSFPYLVSSTTYQAVILPKGYQIGSYEKTKFPGTGPYKLQSYTSGVRATFVRNDAYWGGPQAFDQVVMTFYTDSQSQILALQGGQLDLIPQFGYQEGRPLFRNKALQVFRQKSAVHREIPMAVDSGAWKDKRVRVAMALLLNRPSIIKTLFGGIATLGNDSPFAPNMLATNTSVPQRKQDVARAKALLQAAGVSSLETTLTTQRAYELPDLAVLVQNAAKVGGIDLAIELMTPEKYYSGPQTVGPGGTPWLNAPMTITDWAPRAVPNVYLVSSFKTGGIWNASHIANRNLDRMIDQFTAAVELKAQRKLAGQIQTFLLTETPVIFPYWYVYLAAGKKNIRGYIADSVGLVNLRGVSYA